MFVLYAVSENPYIQSEYFSKNIFQGISIIKLLHKFFIHSDINHEITGAYQRGHQKIAVLIQIHRDFCVEKELI